MPPAPSDLLRSVLATLLPADPPFPSGASVADSVDADAALMDAVPPAFTAGDEATLRAVEAAHPAAFSRLVRSAYLAYYCDAEVRQAIEQTTGYPARPPQPIGYELPPFDEALLDRQTRRAG